MQFNEWLRLAFPRFFERRLNTKDRFIDQLLEEGHREIHSRMFWSKGRYFLIEGMIYGRRGKYVLVREFQARGGRGRPISYFMCSEDGLTASGVRDHDKARKKLWSPHVGFPALMEYHKKLVERFPPEQGYIHTSMGLKGQELIYKEGEFCEVV